MKKLHLFWILVLLAGCNPSRITQTWTAPQHQTIPYKHILVIGVLPETDSVLRARIEGHFSTDLFNLGYKADAAHLQFPPGTFIKGDTARAEALIRAKGYDAVLTIVLLDKKKEQLYVPGKVDYNTNPQLHGRFERYITEVSEKIYSPGYFTEETRYIWENNFYDVQKRQLVYSARSRSFALRSTNQLAHSFAALMIDNLVKFQILREPVEKEK